MLGHKTSLNKFKKTEIISNIFSDHNAMKLEINHTKNTKKHSKTWKLNLMFLKQWMGQQWDQDEKSKTTFKQIKMKTTIQNLWETGKAILRGKVIALQAYLKKEEKAQINNLNLHLRELKKEQESHKQKKTVWP